MRAAEPWAERMSDLSAAAWLHDRLLVWPTPENEVLVGSVVPTGYQAYARVFHPAARWSGERREEVRWTDVASTTGRVAHPEMEWHRITAPKQGGAAAPGDIQAPNEGSLSREECVRLSSILQRFTRTPEVCWFLMWVGFGDIPRAVLGIDLPPDRRGWVELPGREYLLYKGAVDAAPRAEVGFTYQSPNLWWPEDRAWCVATEIDLTSTYVGGTEELIGILETSDLEVLRTRPDARVDAEADRINVD